MFLLVPLEHEITAFTQALARHHFLEGKLTATNNPIPKQNTDFRFLCSRIPQKYQNIEIPDATVNLTNQLIQTASNTEVSRIQISDRLGRFDAMGLFILWAYSSLQIVDSNQNIIFSNLDDSIQKTQSERALHLGWSVLKYHQRITQIFPKKDDPSLPGIVPDHVRIDEWWEFSKELLETLWKNLSAKRKPAKIIRYQKKIHPTDEGRVRYRNLRFRPVLHDFSEMDLVKRSDIDRTLANEPAKLDVLPKHESVFGSVLVKPILGFPDIPERQSPSVLNSLFIRSKTFILLLPKWIKLFGALVATVFGLWLALLQVQPMARIAGADPSTGYAPLEVQFLNDSDNADDYLWELDVATTSDDFQPIHIFEEPGEYTVTLYAYRSPRWEILGFTDRDTIVVHVLPTETPTSDTSGVQIEATNTVEAPTVTSEFSITPTPP